jgi:nucleotide-binding universal stress UspA family protein
MKNILLPTDFSDNALNAARYAMHLFGDTANYVLINAYQVPHSGSTMLISIADILKRDSEQLLQDMRGTLEDEFPGLKEHISILAEMGQADTVLARLADRGECSMVVMGTKGASGLKSVLIGSVASNVIQRVACPVLAIPSGVRPTVPTKILFAMDDESLQRDSCPPAITYIASRGNAKVMILNVLSESEDDVLKAKQRTPINVFDGVEHSFHFEKGLDIGETIVNFAKTNHVDIIAMVRRKKDLLSNLFGQSKTREMIQQLELPLLVLNNVLKN